MLFLELVIMGTAPGKNIVICYEMMKPVVNAVIKDDFIEI